jgi:dUTP pyrophosphatase
MPPRGQSNSDNLDFNCRVAQSVERLPVKETVVGSTPTLTAFGFSFPQKMSGGWPPSLQTETDRTIVLKTWRFCAQIATQLSIGHNWGAGLHGVVISLAKRKSDEFDSRALHHKERSFMLQLPVKKFADDAITPTRKHPTDAGLDFYAYDDHYISSSGVSSVRTGIGVEIPDGFVGILKPKSSTSFVIGAGVIDSSYRGEILFKVINPYRYMLEISRGSAVGQMVIVPCLLPEVVEVNELSVTERGESGGIHN